MSSSFPLALSVPFTPTLSSPHRLPLYLLTDLVTLVSHSNSSPFQSSDLLALALLPCIECPISLSMTLNRRTPEGGPPWSWL